MAAVPVESKIIGFLREARESLSEVKQNTDLTKETFEHIGVGMVRLEHLRLVNLIDAADTQMNVLLQKISERKGNHHD